jgi:hypothetical protein
VCGADPACCGSAWSASCVTETQTVCGGGGCF